MRLTEDVTELLYAQAEQLVLAARATPSERDPRGADQHRRALRRARRRCCARSSRSRPTTRRSPTFWRELLGRFVDATQRRHRAEQRPAARPRRPRARHRLRAGLDDRADVLPAARAGRADGAGRARRGCRIWTGDLRHGLLALTRGVPHGASSSCRRTSPVSPRRRRTRRSRSRARRRASTSLSAGARAARGGRRIASRRRNLRISST